MYCTCKSVLRSIKSTTALLQSQSIIYNVFKGIQYDDILAMDDTDDPYQLLGVPTGSSAQQIKAAYRKLALQHHPDKQQSEADKAAATVTFAKISNAYELLSDPEQRQQYDNRHKRATSGFNAFNPRSDFDDFFGGRRAAFPRNHTFHDPFQVFESFFQNEFGRNPHDMAGHGDGRSPFGGGSIFDNDPFFSSPFGSRSNLGRGGLGFPFGGSLFGGGMFGGGGHDPFAEMERSIQQQMQNGGNRNNNNNNNRMFTSITSTSSSSSYGPRGESVTKSTSQRIINGKRQTVTETVIRKADGTTERHVETSGDDDFPSSGRMLTGGRQQQQPQLQWTDHNDDAVSAARGSKRDPAGNHYHNKNSRHSTQDLDEQSKRIRRNSSRKNSKGPNGKPVIDVDNDDNDK